MIWDLICRKGEVWSSLRCVLVGEFVQVYIYDWNNSNTGSSCHKLVQSGWKYLIAQFAAQQQLLNNNEERRHKETEVNRISDRRANWEFERWARGQLQSVAWQKEVGSSHFCTYVTTRVPDMIGDRVNLITLTPPPVTLVSLLWLWQPLYMWPVYWTSLNQFIEPGLLRSRRPKLPPTIQPQMRRMQEFLTTRKKEKIFTREDRWMKVVSS